MIKRLASGYLDLSVSTLFPSNAPRSQPSFLSSVAKLINVESVDKVPSTYIFYTFASRCSIERSYETREEERDYTENIKNIYKRIKVIYYKVANEIVREAVGSNAKIAIKKLRGFQNFSDFSLLLNI